MLQKFDPFTQRWIDDSPEYPIWQRQNSNPVSREDGTINHEARAERFVLDTPGRRFEDGAAGLKSRSSENSRIKVRTWQLFPITELDELKKKYNSPSAAAQGPKTAVGRCDHRRRVRAGREDRAGRDTGRSAREDRDNDFSESSKGKTVNKMVPDILPRCRFGTEGSLDWGEPSKPSRRFRKSTISEWRRSKRQRNEEIADELQ